MLTVGSLFSGIGGLDLGLERAGMEVIWQSEIDPYGCCILKKHWPEVVNHGNIKDINWGDVVRPDVICGGYPCQPFSTAGKRNGTDDPRHLWPWVREAISELRPKYAILENVRGHVSLGLNVVLGEMASIGYNAEWQIVSAASVGAPHRRDRVIIVAYPNGQRPQGSSWVQEPETELGRPDLLGSNKGWVSGTSNSTNTIGELANTDSIGRIHGQSQVFTADRWLHALSLVGSSGSDVADTAQQFSNGEPDYTRDSARPETFSQSRDSGGAQDVANTDAWKTSRGLRGVSTDTGQVRERRDHARREESHAGRQWWATEPDVGRVAHGVPSRVDRLRGLGNAVVPQVAELIGRMVLDYDSSKNLSK